MLRRPATPNSNQVRDRTTHLAHYRLITMGSFHERLIRRCEPATLSQGQLGEALAASHISSNRACRSCGRRAQLILPKACILHSWQRPRELGDFSPSYLHMKASVRS